MILSNKRETMQASDVILIIDMQNAYMPHAPWGCVSFYRSCGCIQALLDKVETVEKKPFVAFTKFINNPDGQGVWAEYNIVNEAINNDPWMNAIVDDLAPYVEKYPVYKKSFYSSMKIPAIERLVKENRRIVLTGVVSECCVLATGMDAIDMGYHIVYLSDACSGADKVSEDATLEILSRMAPLHVTVMETAEYLGERIGKLENN